MNLSLPRQLSVAAIAFLAFVFLAAFIRVHIRVQTTLIGYQIGKLKAQEGELLERRSALQMDLAKISTRESLIRISKN